MLKNISTTAQNMTMFIRDFLVKEKIWGMAITMITIENRINPTN